MNIKYVAYVDFDNSGKSVKLEQGVVAKIDVDKLTGDSKEIYLDWVNGLISTEVSDSPVMISSWVETILGVYQQKRRGYELHKEPPQNIDFDLTEIFDTEKEAIRSFCEDVLKHRKIFFDEIFVR